MAGTIPTPRSYQTILGDMIDAFLSRYGLQGLRTGGPLLSILEAAAQSDARSTQDVFNLLDATSVDRASGIALDRKAADEDLARLSVVPSSGTVTVTDTSFVKRTTKVYPGKAAPNAGSTLLRVSDASSFPATGAIYIGRGTLNVEGPLSYTAKAKVGTYWELTLATQTQKFHDVNETVTLAQGGARIIPAGSVVRTAENGIISAVSFGVLSSATLPDGETTLAGVEVVCQEAGVIGNIPKGAIVEFTSPPFTGARASNPLPFDNGQAAEDDASLRERIKLRRRTRALGTGLALTTNAKGVVAKDENKSVISASIFAPQGEPAVLFIDDGTGYEEIDRGQPLETLLDQALGGERYFKLNNTPVAKASATSTLSAPFGLVSGMRLAVKVAGVLSEHKFSVEKFRSIGNATAHEVVGSINGDPSILFSARTAENGSKVVLFARSETHEDIEVVKADSDDANKSFGFPLGINYTLKLYRNDRLLYKDGRSAIVLSTPQSSWSSSIASGIYLKIRVDGTKPVVYKITDQDFVDAGTGYSTVSASHPLEAWAAALNYKVVGITASVSSGRLSITSNRGAAAAAAIEIMEPQASDLDSDGVLVGSAGSLNFMQKGVFNATVGLTASGRSNDYTLNRNTGELKLSVSLAEGESLAAGTTHTRAYLQSGMHQTGEVTFEATNLWFVVDGAAALVPTGLNNGTVVTVSQVIGSRRRYATASNAFINVRQGDWMIVWDPMFVEMGEWRVVAATATHVDVERESIHTDQSVAPMAGGIVFVRTAAPVRRATLYGGTNRSLASIAEELNELGIGLKARAFRNKYLRVATETFGLHGDIMLVTAALDGQKLKLPMGKLVSNHTGHLASIESGNSEVGTPMFGIARVTAVEGNQLTVADQSFAYSNLVRFLRKPGSYGNLNRQWFSIYDRSANTVMTNEDMRTPLVGDRLAAVSHFAISPSDSLAVMLDADAVSKNYSVPLYRSVRPVAGQAYGSSVLELTDADNSFNPLSTAFGDEDPNFFREFALYMRARGKSHATGGGTAPAGYHHNKALLWRYARMGPEGEQARVSYVYPLAPSQKLSVTTANGRYAHIFVYLPSGPARTGLQLYDTTKFSTSVAGNSLTFTYSAPTVSLQRATNVVTGTTGAAHGYAAGDTVYISSTDAAFPSGAKNIVSVPSATTFTYNESGTNAGPSAGHSVSSAPVAPNLGAVQVGDIVSINALSLNEANRGVWRVTAVTSTSFTILKQGGVVETAPRSLGLSTNLTFYPIDAVQATATKIAEAVNKDFSSIVSAKEIENGGGAPGTGVISISTRDEMVLGYANAATGSWGMKDGVLYVQESNLSAAPNYINLKSAVDADLVTNSDFDNETMRLVPVTTAALARFMSSPAVSGFYAGSEIVATSNAGKLQLSSNTAGAKGGVQVTGGTANSATATILGSGSVVEDFFSKITIAASQGVGFSGGQWVAVQGSEVQPKSIGLTETSTLSTIASDGQNWVMTFPGAQLVTTRQSITDSTDQWQIERVGRFALYTLLDNNTANPISASVTEGDWVTVALSNAHPSNLGTFRVVRNAGPAAFWVENSAAVEESVQAVTGDSVTFKSYDSVMPGDQLVIDTTAFGVPNRGSFAVVSATPTTITVRGSLQAFSGGGQLGANVVFVRVLEEKPVRLVKQIHTIGQLMGNPDYLEVVFATPALATKMTAAAGVSIQALDKLGFSTELVSGADAYGYAVGLIGEVNRVMYGDPSNPSVYPGVVAAGAQVGVSGPLIKRVIVGLSIRVRSTSAVNDVIDRVKSAVASAVNKVQIGKPVAISTIVSAAAGVEGVVSATVTSSGSSTDLISVQANEKPRVLDADKDILVSVVGA